MLPGHQNQLTVRSVAGTPLEPRQAVRATARYRHQADADTDSGGWRYTSDAVQASTTRPPPPADWTPLPHATDVGMHHIVAEWAPVPDVPAEDVEYVHMLCVCACVCVCVCVCVGLVTDGSPWMCGHTQIPCHGW